MVDSGDSSSVNLGVQFTADRNGSVTGVRFYKSAANSGTHIGSLWTATASPSASRNDWISFSLGLPNSLICLTGWIHDGDLRLSFNASRIRAKGSTRL